MSHKVPQYRIDRIATEDEAWQALVNCVRRLLMLPTVRTSKQAADEARAMFADDSARS